MSSSFCNYTSTRELLLHNVFSLFLVKCFWLHLNRVSLIYSNALSFRSGEHPFSFLHALTCCFLQAPGHTNARCQCSINASARRLTRGVCTRVNIGAVHFCTEGDQASHAVG
jgi:hypothetical protein